MQSEKKTSQSCFRISTVQTFIRAGSQAQALRVGRIVRTWWFRRTDSQRRAKLLSTGRRRRLNVVGFSRASLAPMLLGAERHLVTRLKLATVNDNAASLCTLATC